MKSLLYLYIFIVLCSSTGCYMQKHGMKINYKWKKTMEYYESEKIKVEKEEKFLRRNSAGTAFKTAKITIVKKYDVDGRKTSKEIVLLEGGGSYSYVTKEDTIRTKFPKLFMRRIKYLMGF